MGPKAKKAPRKADGKKKISKAQRLKMLQEEEERRLKEEEEERLRKEREEMERLEKKRLEQEKWEKLEDKDLDRKNEEAMELSLLEMCFTEAEQMKREVQLLSQWKHYLQCDGHPDPTVAQEINTYISLWREETNETFEQVIQKSDQVLSLIDKLTLILLETPPFDLQNKSIMQYKGSILELRDLLFLKFNRATEILLRQASTLADPDSGNMEKVIQAENITVYVWANLKKNPRQRSIRFCGTEIGFEIPRVLATSDIALRLLHTHFDHVSPLPTVAAASDRTPEPSKEDTGVKAAGSAVAELAGSPKPETAGSPGSEAPGSPEPEVAGSSEPEAWDSLVESPAEDLLSAQDEDVEVPLEVQETPRPESSLQVPTVEEDDLTQELEMALLSQRVSEVHLKMLENMQDKPQIFEDDEVDLCQFSTLGGVYHLDVLELPPQCKPVKGWVIVRVLQEGLQKYIYPPEATEEADVENAFPPIEVTLEVHKNVIFFENPQVARWDPQVRHWKTDGISHTSYNPEDRLVSFSLDTFGPVTLIQDTHINMPFQYWELVPLDLNQALFTVKTVFAKIQIHIKDNLCLLASLNLRNNQDFTFLEGKWMTPISFIHALKNAGLNIFPSGHSHFYVLINYKSPMVEMKTYQQMALLSSAFAFGWSRWNIHCDSRKVIFKAREHIPEEESIQDIDCMIIMFTGDRAQRLHISEYSEDFSEQPQEGSEFHSTLYHMITAVSSPAALDSIRSSSTLFVDTVCYMLLSTRPLSYS